MSDLPPKNWTQNRHSPVTVDFPLQTFSTLPELIRHTFEVEDIGLTVAPKAPFQPSSIRLNSRRLQLQLGEAGS